MAFFLLKSAAYAQAPVDAAKPVAEGATACEVATTRPTKPSVACLAMITELMDEAQRYYLAAGNGLALPDLESAIRHSPEELRLAFEQALVDDASGRPQEARKRYDLLRDTPLARAAAVPSAVNLAALGRFDEARKAFVVLSGSADVNEACYAQLWILWLDARTWRGGATELREKLARDTVGLRAGNAQQQMLLNLYAGQGSVDALFAAITASTPEGSPSRRDARTEAAFFAGGYLQYVLGDAEAAQQLYRRELPQSGASLERALIQQFVTSR